LMNDVYVDCAGKFDVRKPANLDWNV
jgi:hypothetical protein